MACSVALASKDGRGVQHKEAFRYDVHKILGIFDPPFVCQVFTDCLQIWGNSGHPLPLSVRTSYMEVPKAELIGSLKLGNVWVCVQLILVLVCL